MNHDTRNTQLPSAERALAGREDSVPVPDRHYVNGNAMQPPFPPQMELAMLAMGCFWGAERRFWEVNGVYSTHVGYAGGSTRNPTYQEVCTGQTGHAEVVRVVFDRALIAYTDLLAIFWEAHDPTQGMRQGNDVGSQYRSGIWTYSVAQEEAAQASRDQYTQRLREAGFGAITTVVEKVAEFYYAEEYHQQYLAKNPNGYCGLGSTGVCYNEARDEG